MERTQQEKEGVNVPNRIIKESIKRSPEIDRLSWFEEVVFYRLIVTADDYGRLDGRMIVLKNDLFPTKDTITKKAVEDAVNKLVSVGLLVPYVDAESNMPYLFFRRWDKHQTVRNKYSKYPAPPEDLLLQANCKQMIADCKQTLEKCCDESESKIESESESKGSVRATRFTAPTLDEVKAYANEKGYTGFNAERFIAYYESNGWRVGRNPMKDWRAACRNWAAKDVSPITGRSKDWKNPALDYKQREYTDDMFGDDFYYNVVKEYSDKKKDKADDQYDGYIDLDSYGEAK